MAVYTNWTATFEEKRDKSIGQHASYKHHWHHWHHAHGHQHLHGKRTVKMKKILDRALVDRAVGDMVYATIDGQLASWTNEYRGAGVATKMPSPSTVVTPNLAKSYHHPVPESTSKSSEKGASWAREAYYDATSGKAEGVTFLNHNGGEIGIPGTAKGGPAYAFCSHRAGVYLADTLIALVPRCLTLHQMAGRGLLHLRYFTTP